MHIISHTRHVEPLDSHSRLPHRSRPSLRCVEQGVQGYVFRQEEAPLHNISRKREAWNAHESEGARGETRMNEWNGRDHGNDINFINFFLKN